MVLNALIKKYRTSRKVWDRHNCLDDVDYNKRP